MTFPSRFKNVHPWFLGFDTFFDQVENLLDNVDHISQFPPMNVFKEDDGGYSIELALAGFQRDDISITYDKERAVLTVSSATRAMPEIRNVVRRGIAHRAFTRSFTISKDLEVKDAEMLNGMLTIKLAPVPSSNQEPLKITVR